MELEMTEFDNNVISQPKFHYITIATKPHIILDKLRERVNAQNETLSVLGAHENRAIGWQGSGNFGIKLKEAHDFLLRDDLDNDDIVLFTDAYDVIYCGNQTEIIGRFLTFDKPIVFGCEKFCNPDPKQEKNYTFKDTEFPYLNSGLYIGRVWALRKCISNYKYNDKHDDQLYWTLQFLNHPELITLDYNNILFLNTAGIHAYDIVWNGIYSYYKDANPLFVHINGPDKNDIRRFIQQQHQLIAKLWFSKDCITQTIQEYRELLNENFFLFLQKNIDETPFAAHRNLFELLYHELQHKLLQNDENKNIGF